jgi:hypothetical protein
MCKNSFKSEMLKQLWNILLKQPKYELFYGFGIGLNRITMHDFFLDLVWRNSLIIDKEI